MMPVGADTVGLSGVFAWRGPADGGVKVPGFGYAATAFGFDPLSPGDAQPIAGTAAGGEFAGRDPLVDHAGAAVEPVGGVGDTGNGAVAYRVHRGSHICGGV